MEATGVISMIPPDTRGRGLIGCTEVRSCYTTLSLFQVLLFLFFIPPLFFNFFCFKSLADIAKGIRSRVIYMEKAGVGPLDPRQIRSFLHRLYERVMQPHSR